MIQPEQLDKLEKYLRTSITIRQPKSKAAFCRKIGISTPTFDKYAEEFRKKGKLNRNGLDKLIDEMAEIDIEAFTKRVYERAMEKTASAKHMELFAKMQGLLIDKSETKVELGLSAGDLSREFLRARRELESSGDGEMLTRPALLSKHLLLDSGQNQQKDSEVEGMAASS